MVISSLSLSNFRNHAKKTFSFSPPTTILLGPNGSGKTNVLEAIFTLAIGKSFRAQSDREMIAFGNDIARVQARAGKSETASHSDFNKEEETKLEIVLTTGSVHNIKTPFKQFKINGVGKRSVDFVGNLKVVLFWPEDLELVTDSPSLRRRYLDFVLMQVDREYRRCLISYEKGVRQRNRLLEAIRDTGAHRHQLLFWDQLLIKNGEYISKKREEYIEFLNKSKSSRLGGISRQSRGFSIVSEHDAVNALPIKSGSQTASGQITNYQIIYDKSIISPQRLEQYKEEEVAAATTLVGPHRDDFHFQIQNNAPRPPLSLRGGEGELRDLSQYGSRGEQRLAILWLKLGELAFMEAKTGEKPVLLLDDIFSELDHPHREIVFDIIGSQQTILTAADEHFVERGKLKNAEIIAL